MSATSRSRTGWRGRRPQSACSPLTLDLVRAGTDEEGRRARRGAHRAIQAAKADQRVDPALPPAAADPRGGRVLARRRNEQHRVHGRAETRGQTGVEMEALTAVQVGLLTIYDMVKRRRSRHGDRQRPPLEEARRQERQLRRDQRLGRVRSRCARAAGAARRAAAATAATGRASHGGRARSVRPGPRATAGACWMPWPEKPQPTKALAQPGSWPTMPFWSKVLNS